MKFNGKKITVTKGRVSSARANDGKVTLVVNEDGTLYEKTMPLDKYVFSVGNAVSYADECFILDSGKLERRGRFTYAPYSIK